MNRRQFTKQAALTLTVAGLAGSAFKCGSEKVSLYISTINGLLREIAVLLPAQSQTIAKLLALATDFDTAYRRGDFDSADSLFNTLVSNLTTFTTDLGVNLSDQVKMWLAVIGATVRTIAVLLRDQVATQPAIAGRARAARSAGAVERLADSAAVDAAFQAAKLR